jgi:hypothetical protein
MTASEVIRISEVILRYTKMPVPPTRTFLEYCHYVGDAAKALTAAQRASIPNFIDWVKAFRKLYDNFDVALAADPMMAYQPANRAAKEFHESSAYVRYFMAGNRASKTQSGYAEHYLVTTGQHKFRQFPYPPASTFIIGVNFSQYAGAVFEKKFLSGEDDNPLSPMFPVGGKWFYHYDERKHLLQLACPVCAEAGKAGSCPHPKSSVRLFSDEGGWEVLQGAQYLLGHFDEHVAEGFFNEARQRTKTVTGGCLIVTGTPLHGTEAWEIRRLYKRFLNGVPANLYDPNNPDSGLFVSVHQIDQFEAGLVPHDRIRADMADMDQFTIDARIYGKPAPLADNPVFDLKKLQEIAKGVKDPIRGNLVCDIDLEKIKPSDTVTFTQADDGPLRIWQNPQPGEVYICAVDTASGLRREEGHRKGDASCASVLRVYQEGTKLKLDMVAQWHGWINPFQYAEDVMRLCVYYNSALCVVELTGGLGLSVVLKLKDEFAYWNLYRERADLSAVNYNLDPRFGVDTNASTKPFMVSALQLLIREMRISVPCAATIQELTAFEQEVSSSGGQALSTPRYRGAKGSPDDRSMSLAIAASVALSYPLLLDAVVMKEDTKRQDELKKMDPFWQEMYKEFKDRANGADEFDL